MSPDGPGHTPAIPPRPTLPDLTAARELGPAETVEARWQQLLLVWQWHHERHEVLKPGSAYPDIVSLIEAAGAVPKLWQLYPFTSHFSLNFSNFTSPPWSVRAPSVDPLHDGRFRVRRPRSSDVIGFTHAADAAVSLVVDNLPAGLGPAVAHDQVGR
ncbi:DUF6193 family natural product biosynthesis protein [Streptomyces sp. NPDC086182]|jgi:hypothetical protein|uniref:DUF6193 family natural product biosynthesis protein n=1 Tax=Streptomyces sp. NPDC086182 TaxID=3155058 RepID=UPI003428141E